MIEVLFAFAITAGGYTDWCRDHVAECTAPQVRSAPAGVIQGSRGGQRTAGTVGFVVIKDTHPVGSLMWRMIYVHESVHILQERSRRYMDKNPYERQALKEKEAYEVGDRYLVSQGREPLNSKEPAKLLAKAEAARAKGLVK